MVVIENVMNMCTQLILFQRVDQIIQKYLFVQKFLKFIFISQVQIIWHAEIFVILHMGKLQYSLEIFCFTAIQLLKDKPPGTFVVRDSNSFPGAFGLALKVATVPANVQTKSSGDPSVDLVRHFLIEPTPKGVRLRGCNNEPVFGNLCSLANVAISFCLCNLKLTSLFVKGDYRKLPNVVDTCIVFSFDRKPSFFSLPTFIDPIGLAM